LYYICYDIWYVTVGSSIKYRYHRDRCTLLPTTTTGADDVTQPTLPPRHKGTLWEGKASETRRVPDAGDWLGLIFLPSNRQLVVSVHTARYNTTTTFSIHFVTFSVCYNLTICPLSAERPWLTTIKWLSFILNH